MGEVPHQGDRISVLEEHNNLLLKTVGDGKTAIESKIYSYGKSINAFAARLLPDEARRLAGEDRVVSVFENTRRKLLTTRSWDFLGMPKSLTKRNPIVESNIIVALLDTGICTEHPSFNDEGYGPPPAKWKGKCDKGANFTGCNSKVIGARYYQLDKNVPIRDDPTPVDNDGHGTHTASTAAGIPVKDASLFDIAKGTARGGVPSARIAMYKVCWRMGCTDMDVLAAFDDAIHDGVDMISISIGGPSFELFKDVIAIGAFHAMRKGILTTCAGGNNGPAIATIENVAPWMLTVGANSIDREFTSIIKLGDGTTTFGYGINIFTMKNTMYPFTNGAHAANLNGSNNGNVSACGEGTLTKDKVKGKIVYCLGDELQDYTIKNLGGAGTIMAVDGKPHDAYFLTCTPATTVVRSKVGDKLDRYINTMKKPQAVIYKSKTVSRVAPSVAFFSSRGPQLLNPNILKPDVTAPGLNILAAYPEKTPVNGDPTDTDYSAFNFMSGTSMACPHASAAAAYVKSFHPDWSPAAIKSAVMTTATPMKIKDEYGALSTGSGQINPSKAINPGLLYDVNQRSYISYLCKQGYNSTTISLIIGGKPKHNCSSLKPALGTDGLNYPSMHMYLNSTKSSIFALFYRTVTNVGHENSVYKAKVTSPKELSVIVFPKTLKFSKNRPKRSFKVFLKGGPMKKGTGILSATLEWSNESHSVKSPIVVFNQQTFS
ncbi:hypothetical protein DITRI_Ditri06bG0046500 [Diplodiscus trichospermus]